MTDYNGTIPPYEQLTFTERAIKFGKAVFQCLKRDTYAFTGEYSPEQLVLRGITQAEAHANNPEA